MYIYIYIYIIYIIYIIYTIYNTYTYICIYIYIYTGEDFKLHYFCDFFSIVFMYLIMIAVLIAVRSYVNYFNILTKNILKYSLEQIAVF